MDNIAGIPKDILTKSFPGVHHGLFRFLFRADPVIKLAKISGPQKEEIVQTEVESLVSHSHPVQNDVKEEVMEQEEGREEAPEEILGLDLGEGLTEPQVKSETLSTQNIILEEVQIKTESQDFQPELKTRGRLARATRKNSIEIHKVQIKSEFPSIEETFPGQDTSHSTKYSLRQRKVLSYTDTIEIDVSNSGSDSDLSEDASYEEDSTQGEGSEEEHNEAEDEDSNCDVSQEPKEKIEIKRYKVKSNKAMNPSKSKIESTALNDKGLIKSERIHKVIPLICPEKNCGKIFNKFQYLNRHLKEIHKISPIICKHCPLTKRKQFKSQTLLNAHILRSHREIKKYKIKCTQAGCDATFRHNYILHRHLKYHRDPQKGAQSFSRIGNILKKTTCPHCNKPITIERLKHHIFRFHNPQRKKNVICESCGKSFFTAYDLRRHSKVYHNPQMEGQVHKCPDCDRKYSKYNQYVNHRKMKSCRASHQCSYCSQKFPLPGQLREHENTHTKNVQYECEDCGSVFYTKIALRQHSLGHEKKNSNEKGVVNCPHCDLTFTKKGTLRHHIYKVHNLDREFNFKCSFPQCNKTFIQEHRLKKHEESHKTGSNGRCICSLCGKILKSRTGLKKHEKIHLRKK